MAGAVSVTKNARVLLLCVLAALAACQKDPGAAPAAAPQVKVTSKAPVKQGPTAVELTSGMVEAAGEGKSQGAVNLKFELAQKPKLGQALEINLALLPLIDAATATITATGAGVTLGAGAAPFEFAPIVAGELYRHTLSLTPSAEGVLVIGVTVQLKMDESTETRAFSIPIIVDR